MNEEHTWTGNSEVDAAIIMLDRIDCSPEYDSRVDAVEATLRRLHARIQELEAMLEAPQPQADALDAERWSEIGKSIERVCGELPEDFEITINLENGAGTVVLLYPNGEECENFPHDDGFAGVVNAAIEAAIAAAKEMK